MPINLDKNDQKRSGKASASDQAKMFRAEIPVVKESAANDCWPTIGSQAQIPCWLRDNDYIVTGHPMPTYSYAKSSRLWWCLHMETMNIWTHLIGSLAFVAIGLLLAMNAIPLVEQVTDTDKLVFGLMLTAAVVCFGLSTAFHTLRSHSYSVHHFWGKMDILGICILALGGGASATFYAFYDNEQIQRIHRSLNVGTAIATVVALIDTGGGGSKMRTLRASVFGLLAISAMLPIFHCITIVGWAQACRQIGAHYFLCEIIALLIGLTFFVGRIPERFRPGMFDVWLHSHQLFHAFSVIATLFHVAALWTGVNFVHVSEEYTGKKIDE